jgi:Flp pilus assembly protein TadG
MVKRSSMWRDQRGAVTVETLLALPFVLLSFLGVYQLTLLYSAHLVVQRAASAAARAAAVFLADDPSFHAGGEGREVYAREAARRVLLAAPGFDAGSLAVTVTGDRAGFALLTATVQTRVRCTVFALDALCGGGPRLSGSAALPIQSDGGSL